MYAFYIKIVLMDWFQSSSPIDHSLLTQPYFHQTVYLVLLASAFACSSYSCTFKKLHWLFSVHRTQVAEGTRFITLYTSYPQRAQGNSVLSNMICKHDNWRRTSPHIHWLPGWESNPCPHSSRPEPNHLARWLVMERYYQQLVDETVAFHHHHSMLWYQKR
jgi:hypothetical protein